MPDFLPFVGQVILILYDTLGHVEMLSYFISFMVADAIKKTEQGVTGQSRERSQEVADMGDTRRNGPKPLTLEEGQYKR